MVVAVAVAVAVGGREEMIYLVKPSARLRGWTNLPIVLVRQSPPVTWLQSPGKTPGEIPVTSPGYPVAISGKTLVRLTPTSS